MRGLKPPIPTNTTLPEMASGVTFDTSDLPESSTKHGCLVKVKAQNVPTFTYRRLLTGKPEQQRFTIRSGVLTSISSRQRSAISSRTNGLWTRSLQLDKPWHLCLSQPHSGLHPAPCNVLRQRLSILVASITRY